MHRNGIICLLLVGVTFGLYWPVQHYGLVFYDDPLFLTDTPEIQSGLNWPSLRWCFSSVILANWHPVTTLSFVVDHQFFGTNPGAEHVINVLFHAANAVLLFLLLNTMTQSAWRSALVAAIFAWHPLRVESVAWITERKDVLSGFFFLLTLIFYAKHNAATGQKSKVFYGLSLLAFALGLMSKAMLVTVPFVLLLLDIWPLKRWTWLTPLASAPLAHPAPGNGGATLTRLIWTKWPFFALAGVLAVVTFIVQKNSGAVESMTTLGTSYRIANAITSYARYLGKLVWPVDLAVIYPYVRMNDWLSPALIALVLLAVSVFCWWQWRRRPWLAMGWFWYLGTSVPIIGLVQVGESALCDRYTYLILIGPVIALVWLIPDLWAQEPVRKVWLGLGSAAVLGSLLVLTRQQVQYWHDTVSLFAHALAVTQNNAGAESGLATGLVNEKRLDEALPHFRTAQMLNPDDPDNFVKSGDLLMKQSQWAAAADDTFTALHLAPNNLAAEENLGAILPHLGRPQEGVQHWEAAVKLAPDHTDLLNNLAWLLATSPNARLRNGPRAIQLAEHACELTHYQKTVFIGTLAASYAEAGRFDDAIATAQKACANASAHGETELLQRNQQLLAIYQTHQAYHEPEH